MNPPNFLLRAHDDPYAWRHTEWPEFIDHLVLTPEGVFAIRREGESIYKRPARAEDFERIFGQKVKGRLFQSELHLQHRVPYQLLLQAVNFFRCVWKQQRREDVLLLYYFEQKHHYQLVHPLLKTASWSHVAYDFPETPETAVRFGSIHSHGQERAYHSQRDLNDDRSSPGIHVIIGNLERPYHTVKCIASDGTNCFDVPLWDIFVEPKLPAFPPSWFLELPRPERRTHYDPGL